MRQYKVVDISISNNCNFRCNYCISNSTNKPIPTNLDGSARVFKDMRFNERGFVDHSRIRKYNLVVRGDRGSTYNYGILNSDGTIDRSGDHVIENDFIDYNSLISFLREKLPDWVIQLGGGEPLYNPGIDDFLIEITKSHKVILSTNLSLISKYQKILDIDSNQLFYRIGFHPSQYPLNLYLDNINTLRLFNKKILVNFVLHPSYEENGIGKAYVDFLKDNLIPHEVTRFHGEYNGIMYPTKELSMMEQELLSDHAKTIYDFYSKDEPGNTMLTIYPDGNIYQCPKKTSFLGDIYNRQRYSKMNIKSMPNCFSKDKNCQSVVSQDIALKLFM